MEKTLLIVNFGGPRSLKEIRPFLTSLLTDPDVIRTPLPALVQNLLFRRIARKRTKVMKTEYQKMDGRSPIFDDTENLAQALPFDTLTFHRYLPSTHRKSLKAIEDCPSDQICVFPLFPQFSYATTGSIARFFKKHLSEKAQKKLRWIQSYADHPAFIDCFTQHIKSYLTENQLDDVALFFSPHGVPQNFICTGDPYQKECEASFTQIAKNFSPAQSILAYQSKFGKGEWLRPYTDEVCASIHNYVHGKPTVVFIPLSFTSDHVETLVEVEDQYLPPVKKAGLTALRCPAFNLSKPWIDCVIKILNTAPRSSNDVLVRNEHLRCPKACKAGLCPYVVPMANQF